MAYIHTRKTKNGKTHYRVQVRLKGYPTQSATFDRKTDAKRWASQTESAIREGRHFKSSEARRHTLGEAIERYITSVLPTKPKSKQRQGAQLLWWKDHLGAYTLSDITPALIAEYRDILLNTPTPRGPQRQPATVVRYLAALSHLFSIAVNEWGWIESNPLRKVTKPKEPRGRVRFLSGNERDRLLNACRESNNYFLYPVVVLALSTGMRSGEIMQLKWEDIDLEVGRIILHETKNDERRSVPLAGHALDLIRELSSDNETDTTLVFPGRNPNRNIDLRNPWLKALEDAEIKDFRFHDLRHSAASYLAMNGASLAEIADILGHKTLQMVKRYAHLSESHTAGVVASMNAKIFS